MTRISEHKIIALLMVMALLVSQFAFLPVAAQGEETPYGESSVTTDGSPDTDTNETTGGENGEEDAGEGSTFAVAAAAPYGISGTALIDLKPYGDMTDAELASLDIVIYKGFLPYYYEVNDTVGAGLFKQFLKDPLVPVAGAYELETGIYSYHVTGDGYYHVIQIFIVSDDDITAGTKEVPIVTGPLGGELFEPDPNRYPGQSSRGNYDYIPSTALVHSQEKLICLWPEEIISQFTTDDLSSPLVPLSFDTPFFNTPRALHAFTTQDELMDFIADLSGDNLYVYDLGKSPVYSYNIPILVFTTSNIPSGASLSKAAEIVSSNGKPTVWHQAQIHPNEPASGEAALVMAQELLGDFGDDVLDDINVVLIPRINVDGSKIFGRYTAQGFDMNRDHLRLKADELVKLHGAYIQFMPEMTIDGHEYPDYMITAKAITGGNPADYEKMNDSDDLQIDPATSLNNSPAVTTMGIDAVQSVFDSTQAAGLRPNHYGTTVNNPIGRAYYGLYGSVSILVETRGIGAGSSGMERRVYGQVLSMKSMYLYAAANSEELIETVAEARTEIIANGKYYDEDDILVLYHQKSGNTVWPYGALQSVRFDLYGEAHYGQSLLELEDIIARSRPRPTAYVIPLNEGWTNTALHILESQGAEIYKLDPGTTLPLQQYYFDEYTGRTVSGMKDFNAALHAEKDITFPNGAAIIPMDQVAGNVIAMIMEPDVNDSTGYDGTLVQSGVVKQDADGNFPIYRYIQDDPRTALNLDGNVVTPPRTSGGGSSSGGSNKADSFYGAVDASGNPLGSQSQDRSPVAQADIVSQVKEKLATVSTADVVVKNASSVSSTVLKAMADAATEVNGTIRLLADTTEDNKVIGRLYINPSANTLEGEIKLGVFPASAHALSVSALFDKYFENTTAVVELEHRGSFGMELEVAVKLDLDELDTTSLLFYTYDQSSNKYYRLETTYFIDTNGYLHFTTNTGGAIVVTDVPLAHK